MLINEESYHELSKGICIFEMKASTCMRDPEHEILQSHAADIGIDDNDLAAPWTHEPQVVFIGVSPRQTVPDKKASR